jgi:hypothetical protein
MVEDGVMEDGLANFGVMKDDVKGRMSGMVKG